MPSTATQPPARPARHPRIRPVLPGTRRPGGSGRAWAGLVVAGTLLVTGLRSAAADPDPFLDVIAAPRFFKTPAVPRLSVRLRDPAQVDLLLTDTDGRVCAHRESAGVSDRADFTLTNLPPVAKGTYFFWLLSHDARGRRQGIHPLKPGGGDLIQVRESAVDEAGRRVTYLLPRAACVRVRAGFHEGPYLEPLISASVLPPGRHELPWDGTGQNGVFRNLYQHPGLRVNILAVSLPSNILVDESRAATNPPPAPAVRVELPARLEDWRQGPPAAAAAPWIQDDYRLEVSLTPEPANRVAAVRVDAAPADRARLTRRRFELMLFLDATFLVEDERSLLPFTYRFSTRGLTPGRHVLTVNTIDPDGSVGTRSIEFEVP